MLKIGLTSLFFLILGMGAFQANAKVLHNHDLEVSLERHGDTWEKKFYIVSKGELQEILDSSEQEATYLLDGKPLPSAFWEDVRSLRLTIVSDQHPFVAPRDTIQLDTFMFLQRLPIHSLESIELDLKDYFGKIILNFPKWQHYEHWKKTQSVTSFILNSEGIRPDFEIDELYGFDLEWLFVPLLLNDELLQFPNLKGVGSYGIFSNFTQQLFALENLETIVEYNKRYDNSFETQHSQRYAEVLRYVNCFPETLQNTDHAFQRLTQSAITAKNIDDRRRKFEIMVYENDMDAYSGHTPENDTLLFGKVKKGKRKDLWVFKLKDQYPRNDKEKHRVDFENIPRFKFPQNGSWSLFYTNGNSAIEGSFVNGRKNGEWTFYHEDGTTESTRNYRNDTLVLNIIQFELNGNLLESRVYYNSQDRLYQSIQYVGKEVRLNGLDYNLRGTFCFSMNQRGCMNLKFGENTTFPCSFQGTNGFEEQIKVPMLNKLYPEYTGQPFPFKIIK